MPASHKHALSANFGPGRLAARPYCANGMGFGLRVRPQAQALQHTHIQANSPALRWRLVFDIDRPGALFAATDASLAPASWIAVNPSNGHAHIGYELAEPITTSPEGRKAPIRYAAAIESAYKRRLGADARYVGLICKNPSHEAWDVHIHRSKAYDLPELAEWLPGPLETPKKTAEQPGPIGRNVALFDDLRYWAYRQPIGQAQNLEAFFRACLYRAAELNVGGLSENEVKHVARSVSKWVWRRFDKEASDERFSKLQAHRGQLSGKARLAASEDKRASARLMRSGGMSYAAIAAELDVSKGIVHKWCND